MENRKWLLKATPKGQISPSHFHLTREAVRQELGDGEVLLKNLVFSCDPAQRTWLTASSYIPQVQPGEVMPAMSLAQVVKSRHPNFVEGEVVSGVGGWQEFFVFSSAELETAKAKAKDPSLSPWQRQQAKYRAGFLKLDKVSGVLPPGVPNEAALSLLGITGLTAWTGLLKVGRMKTGDVVLVSGAAGSTGSFVGQLAKAKGAKKVIGIAGGKEKCESLKREFGFDAALDYKAEREGGPSLLRQLKEAAPQGVDVFFDNVGGDVLETGLFNIKKGARIVLCGAISQYDKKATEMKGPRNLGELIVKGASMQGFIVMDFAPFFREAAVELAKLYAEGRIVVKHDIVEGFENLPNALCRLLAGKNVGKQLCRL
uniref:Enoyl reductase (ER) domain-containing protein n=1 Tax=Chromera velia CCMP2878 TaxID=1169474 RepID=A0A0G4FXM4_9ALVE|mmetsp:Transcript_36266/g.71344  ORF Transcript_36266/g.71344 Transcript_36266/m.71344 type:complete len:371 (-) Transcript_36266:171-1283(-)|eukprot:Cvel_19273.t1-p1 / transcript=Cvel_19273.t1 / gene=Cvel_19273 / organism=Chromera_velia_CCMP2878 / gene_product=Putative NADP-dependent oxidoreductase YfmJ, putative / transcript_product=Putative NADP-dependent oxidoreductase YfmJ, putative / location=Cvel_scaffold1650:12403-16338(-) / protein_length=370 / sequence_SO=supercontig / SO=protein_coding / is_pseudo=false